MLAGGVAHDEFHGLLPAARPAPAIRVSDVRGKESSGLHRGDALGIQARTLVRARFESTATRTCPAREEARAGEGRRR